MRENVNIAHLCLNIIFTGPCKLNILEFLAVLSVLQAVGICTMLWFRSPDKQQLGVWGSFATLIYKEAVCLVRPENTSPCRLRSDEMLLLQIRQWIYGICCWCSASCHRMRKAVKISSLQAQRNRSDFFFLSGLECNYFMSDQASAWDVSQPMSFQCEDDK